MTNNDQYTELGVDNKLQPLSSGPSSQSTQNYYMCIINPALPSGTAGIDSDEFYYQSLTPETISLLGREGTGADFKQIAIIFRSNVQDGTHPILPGMDVPVRAAIIAEGVILNAKSGSVTITRDAVTKTIKGNGSFKTELSGADHKVEGIKFEVAPTGPIPA